MNGIAFSLILGTATPGGGFPVFGDAYAESLNAQEPRLRIETRNTKGSTENVPLLEAGKLDLGLVAGELASEQRPRHLGDGEAAAEGHDGDPAAQRGRDGDVFLAGHVRGQGGQPGAPHRRPQGQGGGAWNPRIRNHGAGANCFELFGNFF